MESTRRPSVSSPSEDAKRISHEAAVWATCFEEIKKRVGDRGFSPTDLKEIASTIYISIKRR
jgi:hypothetical protein